MRRRRSFGGGRGAGARGAAGVAGRGFAEGGGAAAAQRGSASVEAAALAALVALLVVATLAAVVAGGEVGAGRDLAGTIGRRLRCAPRLPDACRHHALVPAYGWPLARLARALAPPPSALPGADGAPLVAVDFRRCRRPSCALAAGPRLTAANRRTTAFTELRDRRSADGWVEVVYWLYRPSLGWEAVRRRVGAAALAAAADTRVLESQDPALVPLETLPGRDHYDFPPGEEPPWRWRVPGRYPGWSS